MQGEAPVAADGHRGAAFWWASTAVTLLTLITTTSATASRAIWVDEAVTARFATMPWGELASITIRSYDGVHAAYYALMHVLGPLVGTDPWVTRVPSGVAMTVTCALIIWLTSMIGNRWIGVAAGGIFAVTPLVIEFGNEGRSFALATMLATASTVAFVTAIRSHRGRGLWLLYVVLVVMTAYVSLIALLIVIAHLVTAMWSRPGWPRVRTAMLAVLASVVLVLPLALIVVRQSGQVAYVRRTSPEALADLPTYWFGGGVLQGFGESPVWRVMLITLTAWAVVCWGLIQWWRFSRSEPKGLDVVTVALPWLVVPVLAIVTVSFVSPLLAARYVAFTAPALAMLMAYGLAVIRLGPLVVAVVIVWLVGGAGAYAHSRAPDGKDSWGPKQNVLASAARPGDLVVFTPDFYGVIGEVDGVGAAAPVSEQALLEVLARAKSEEGSRLPQSVWVVPFFGADPTGGLGEGASVALREAGYTVAQKVEAGNATVVQYKRAGR